MLLPKDTPRLLAAAREFNIGKETLLAFLDGKGFEIKDFKPNSKLSPEMYKDLKTEFTKNGPIIETIFAGSETNETYTPRLLVVAKELNIEKKTLLDFLSNQGYNIEGYRSNSKLSSDMYKALNAKFSKNDPNIDTTPPGVKPIETADEEDVSIKEQQDTPLHIQFETENQFQSSIDALLSNPDIFKDRKEEKITNQGESTYSSFTDFEAFSICLGLTDNHARFIAQKYFDNPSKLQHQIEAHNIAMKALAKHETTLISNIIQLPPLPFKTRDVTVIFHELEKRIKFNPFPAIRILLKNGADADEKIILTFYQKDTTDHKLSTRDYLSIKRKGDYYPLKTVSRSGKIKVQGNKRPIIPVLQLFVRFSQSTRQMILNYGLETGECSICGRKLTNPESIRRGIGPDCGGWRY